MNGIMRISWAAILVTACGSSSAPRSAVTAPAAPAAPAPPQSAPAVATAPSAVPLASAAPPPRRYPDSERIAVRDRYGDLEVVDEYRWLEDAKDPRVTAWTAAENELTRNSLDAIADRPKIRARVAALLSHPTPSFSRVTVAGTSVLAVEHHPPRQQGMLVAFADPADPATRRVVLDANEIDPSGKTAIDFYVPSLDGKRVAVSLSTGGTESGGVHVYEVATGAALPDVIPRVQRGTAGGSLAWNAEGTGFWYTRYPAPDERPSADLDFYQQIYFHKLGATADADRYVLGKDFPRIAEVALRSSHDGKTVLARVANGDGGEAAFYAIDAAGRATQLFRFADQVTRGVFAPDGTLYLISHQDAPRGKVLRLRRPYTGKPEPVIPEGDGVIDDIAATPSRLYVSELMGGPSRLRSFRIAGHGAPEIIAPPVAIPAIGQLHPIGKDDLLYRAESYTTTPVWYRYTAAARKSEPTAMIEPMPFAMDDVEVVRETCTSADGTEVPLNVLRRRGIALDGSHPTLLTGYGGYGIGLVPRLRRLVRLWIDQGGVFAEANLRGGNEFGEAWHAAGRLTHKQHVFDDFYACARALVDHGYTRPEHLAIQGRSNGGLLMGAALTQHPEMYRAVVSGVGIYDMLRFELTSNGAFNVTEFGTVNDPAQLRALYAYSPYHHVHDGTAYPAILLTTGANDPRVDPYNSRKMVARLQAANPAGHPVLLRAASDVGHGAGSPLSAVIDEATDSYAFLMRELGMHYTE